jgi:hypothetical protein
VWWGREGESRAGRGGVVGGDPAGANWARESLLECRADCDVRMRGSGEVLDLLVVCLNDLCRDDCGWFFWRSGEGRRHRGSSPDDEYGEERYFVDHARMDSS